MKIIDSSIFLGPMKKVDDCIARDISWIQTKLDKDVLVVTEDDELRRRCRKNSITSSQSLRRAKKVKIDPISDNNSSQRKVTFLDSKSFAQILVSLEVPEDIDNSDSVTFEESAEELKNDTSRDFILENLLRKQVELKQDIETMKATISKSPSRKVKSKLEQRITITEKDYEVVCEAYGRVSNWWSDTSVQSTSRDYDIFGEGAKMLRYLIRKGRPLVSGRVNGAEETWERVILAEQFRRSLLDNQQLNLNTTKNSLNSYQRYFNQI